jgi:hypothetical protein
VNRWSDAGFGTDPDGDARRRAELEPARVDPDDLVAHLRAADRLGILAAPDAALRAASEGDLAGAIRRTSHLVPPSAAEVVEVLGAEVVEQLDPHAITRTEYPSGVAWACACGRWEGFATGPSSARWAGADHARHVRAEEAGARGE